MVTISGGTNGRGRVGRRAATIAALVGLGLASGGLSAFGALTPDLSISYRSVTGAKLFQVILSGFPTHFDPYERTNGQRVLEVAVDPTVKASWRASSPG